MSDNPPGAYDTGSSGFDATRNADNPVMADERPPEVTDVQPPSTISDDTWNHAVGAWIDAHVRSSPIAQASGAWDHLHAVLPRLRELLERELKI